MPMPKPAESRLLPIGAVVVGLLVGLSVVWVTSVVRTPTAGTSGHGSVPPSPASPTPTAVVVPNGTSFTVAPGAFVVYRSNDSPGSVLVGMFSDRFLACGGCAGPLAVVLVLDTASFLNFTTIGGGLSTEGPSGLAVYVGNGSVFSALDPGNFFLVFWNNAVGEGTNWTVQFTVTYPFELYRSSPAPYEPANSTAPASVLGAGIFELGGSVFGGPGSPTHEAFTLSPAAWNWSLNGSFSSSGGAATLQIDADGFSFQPVLFSSGPSAGSAFHLTLPPGTYDVTIIDPGFDPTGCGLAPPGCPMVTVNLQALDAVPG